MFNILHINTFHLSRHAVKMTICYQLTKMKEKDKNSITDKKKNFEYNIVNTYNNGYFLHYKLFEEVSLYTKT